MPSAPTPQALPWEGPEASAAILGVGLIGASFAHALRRSWPRLRLLGFDRPQALNTLENIVDEAHPLEQLRPTLRSRAPQLVVLCLPLDAIVGALPELAKHGQELGARRPALVIDTGSVKGSVLHAAAETGCSNFVGGHPMAGSEQSGAAAGDADMLQNATFALCRGTASDATLALARALVTGIGACPRVMDAQTHDRSVALTSHLPHLVAYGLMDMLAARSDRDSDPSSSLVAGSWRDATRVAASSPGLWREILSHNREAVLACLEEFRSQIAKYGEAGTHGDFLAPTRAQALKELREKLYPTSDESA